MKKYLKFAVALFLGAASMTSSAQSLTDPYLFNHLGVDVNVGTLGIGFEFSTPVSHFVTMRAGATFMPKITFNTDVDGTYTATYQNNTRTEDFTMDVKGDLSRAQGHVVFNIYPFASHSSFYVAAGGYFGGNKILKITGHSDELENLVQDNPTIEIGDYKIPVDEHGNVKGGLRVNSFRPYLGLGFGRPVPHGRLNFGVELGVQFMGKMQVYTDYGTIEDILEESDDDWQKWIDKLQVYPVLKFTLSGRIF